MPRGIPCKHAYAFHGFPRIPPLPAFCMAQIIHDFLYRRAFQQFSCLKYDSVHGNNHGFLSLRTTITASHPVCFTKASAFNGESTSPFPNYRNSDCFFHPADGILACCAGIVLLFVRPCTARAAAPASSIRFCVISQQYLSAHFQIRYAP